MPWHTQVLRTWHVLLTTRTLTVQLELVFGVLQDSFKIHSSNWNVDWRSFFSINDDDDHR